MASLKNGILGGFSSKIGAVVGVMRNGECYIRSVPKKRKKPYTANELLNQRKFRLVTTTLKLFKPLINVGFANDYQKRQPIHLAIYFTRKEALVNNGDGYIIDPDLLKISKGKLLVRHMDTQLSDAGELTIHWDDNSNYSSRSFDQLLFLAYDPVQRLAEYRTFNGALRGDGEFKIDLATKFKGSVVDTYIGFVAADRRSQSDSEYLGRFDIP